MLISNRESSKQEACSVDSVPNGRVSGNQEPARAQKPIWKPFSAEADDPISFI